jgi:hypothetical protein
MFVARKKKQESIVEYVLYMWQVEDLIRANQLDINLIKQHIISQYDQPEEVLTEITEWWDNLAEMMRMEKKESSGHLQININTVNDINQLHLRLLKMPNEIAYQHLYQTAVPYINEFELKSDTPFPNDVEACLTAIYSSFLWKLRGNEISGETQQALKAFGKLLAMLSLKYKQDEEGKLENDLNDISLN